MVNLLPANGGPTTITKSDALCRPSQQKQVQTSGSPRLQAAPGAKVALQYQENGHVTLPDTVAGKPSPSRGTVFIYGTQNGATDFNFLDVHSLNGTTGWNAAGTGGNAQGKLLAKMNYDDGQCYQVNGGAISQQRQKEFPHPVEAPAGADIWCNNTIAIPTDAKTGEPYSLFWVWDWSTLAGTPGLPDGKLEIYTTCMDVDVTDNASDGNSSSNSSTTEASSTAPGVFAPSAASGSSGTAPTSTVVAASSTSAAFTPGIVPTTAPSASSLASGTMLSEYGKHSSSANAPKATSTQLSATAASSVLSAKSSSAVPEGFTVVTTMLTMTVQLPGAATAVPVTATASITAGSKNAVIGSVDREVSAQAPSTTTSDYRYPTTACVFCFDSDHSSVQTASADPKMHRYMHRRGVHA
jgi:hypothetical protein